MIEHFASWLTTQIFDLGYIGIFLLMAVESSFIPFPSEVVLIPAGFLAYEGKMSIALILLFAIAGSLVGAYINYYLSMTLGRRFIVRFGRYFLISEETLAKMDRFFATHGPISTFTGRLIPGVRQLISIPAGLCRMDLKHFFLYTALGAGIWSLVLILLGYFIGQEQQLLQKYLKEITYLVFVGIALLLMWYYRRHKKVRNER
jgi:membrane protein DedA with SNARE-associated domain